MRGRGYFNYGALAVTGDESPHKGFSYKTATSIIENVIAKKELFLPLFSDDGTGGEIAITTSTQKYVDRKGKRVYLTPFQMKLVTAFAQVIDTLLEKDGVKTYVKELPFRIEDRERDERGKSKQLPEAIRCTVDIPELTRLMYSRDRIGGKQIDKVRDEIVKLSELTQVFSFKDERGGKLIIEAPLITLGKRVKYETKDGVVKLSKVEIVFEDVFVYEINDRYSLSPITLLQLWNETGVQTELFTMLLFLLQNVRGHKIKQAKAAVAARRAELKKQKKDPEEIKAELKELKENLLTYKESVASLLERLGTDKYKDKGKYIHFAKLNKDLKQAAEALLKMGIISKYYESIGNTGGKVCNFVINDRWLINEARKIRALLPPDEAKDMEEAEEEEAPES